MILEFVMSSLISCKIVKIITNETWYKLSRIGNG